MDNRPPGEFTSDLVLRASLYGIPRPLEVIDRNGIARKYSNASVSHKEGKSGHCFGRPTVQPTRSLIVSHISIIPVYVHQLFGPCALVISVTGASTTVLLAGKHEDGAPLHAAPIRVAFQ